MRIKVFGERNTGTNALCQIIKNNSASTLHPGTMKEIDQGTKIRVQVMRRQGVEQPRIEACIDRVFEGRKATEQWKHAATKFDCVEDFFGTHVVFLVRHPLSWLLSLFRNPYHALIDLPDTFEEFLVCNWKALARDRLEGKVFTPVTLYEEKVASYLYLSDALDKNNISYTFLKFEEIATDQASCFNKIVPFLDDPVSDFVPLEKSTKTSDKNFDYYREYYGKQLWRDEVGDEAGARFSFDAGLMDRFGYH